MKASEKLNMINTYKSYYSHFLNTGSEIAQLELRGMKTILMCVLSKEEINRAENECKIESKYCKDLFIQAEDHLKSLNINYLLKWEMNDLYFIVDEAQFSEDVNKEAYNCLLATVRLLENEKEKGKVA